MNADLLINSGRFFCQDCCAEFASPADGHDCPKCGSVKVSESPDESDEATSTLSRPELGPSPSAPDASTPAQRPRG